MHILITDIEGKKHVRKKSDIRALYSNIKNKTIICFNGNKNTPIMVSDTVEDFFNIHLAK